MGRVGAADVRRRQQGTGRGLPARPRATLPGEQPSKQCGAEDQEVERLLGSLTEEETDRLTEDEMTAWYEQLVGRH